MRVFLAITFSLLLLPACCLTAASYSHADLRTLPELRSGDLIFQTILESRQAAPVMLATGSLYTHVGIIHKTPQGYQVIEAIGPVSERKLTRFVQQGWGEKFTILRYPGLTPAQREAIVHDAESYLGRGYNFTFSLQSKTIYCSELPYLAYRSQHLSLGTLQKIGELHMDNFATKQLFEARWRTHPACKARGMDEATCWSAVLKEPIITPASLARDPKLVQIYSNYPL